ncbi:endoribonuclease YbeY [Patiriisocius marinistellae]|uniref:Endoribonuclease YbeY n=1 Tax=Patiriisocius marinistellae TaxID=2494560 RepID=A0A5J4FXK5_9FLAO|nr:rRNA maturation RNase YbeY [Patiriisocius marinistellae]GEQ84876.1 endoribonuclease YbeY [Patiriisocius marinistellae]
MISFYSETDFIIGNESNVKNWIIDIIESEGFDEGDIGYIFCDDNYLHKMNVEFLDHDTLTDIISFDYSMGKQIHGEIYISIDRVKENAEEFNAMFVDELHRVIIHGILHYCGYKDKTSSDAVLMRSKENEALSKRNFV